MHEFINNIVHTFFIDHKIDIWKNISFGLFIDLFLVYLKWKFWLLFVLIEKEKIVFVLENILEYENWIILRQIAFSLLWISHSI
jgi:hypothetical protein